MEVKIPHRIEFKVEKPVPISDVVASLLATERLLRDTAPLLEECFPGLHVEKIDVSVSEISEGSLKEILIAALVLQFQKDLVTEVPAAIHDLTGLTVPDGYHTIVSMAFIVLLLHGIDFIYTQANKGAFSARIRKHLEEVVEQLSQETGVSTEKISHIIEAKYGRSRLRVLANSAVRFFTVSKRDNNAPVLIGDRTIDRPTVSDIPSDAQLEEANVPEIVQQYEDVHIDIHAQDMDRTKQGWAAVVPKIGPKRLKMELYPPIQPEDLYTRTQIRGDVSVVLQKRADGSYQPSVIHLMQLRD